MRLGKASAFGVFATVHIAEHAEECPVPAKDISAACGIPLAHLNKILQQLVRSRILRSERGPSGGFSLRSPPSKITLLEIVEAIDGPIVGDLEGQQMVIAKQVAKQKVQGTCNEVARHARSLLQKHTISDLVS